MNKIAVITGAGSGIGQAIAFRLAQDDCHVVILETNEIAAQTTIDLVRQSGGAAEFIACDVSKTESVKVAFE